MLPAGSAAKIKTQVARADPLVAPFAKGQQLAMLKVSVGEQPLVDVPLVALDETHDVKLFFLREFNRIVIAGEELSREMWKHGDDWGYAGSSLGEVFRTQLGEGYITSSDGDYHRDLRRSLRPLFAGQCIHRHLHTIHGLLATGFAALNGQSFDLHQQLIFLFTQGLNNTMLLSKAPEELIVDMREKHDAAIARRDVLRANHTGLVGSA